MLRRKSHSVARSCPREMVFADIAVWNTTVQVGQNVFGDLATDRHTASLPHENHDTSRPLYLEHEESIQYVGRHHDCKIITRSSTTVDEKFFRVRRQFEQHRKVHLIDETYCSCVRFLVFHVDLCGHAVHDFDGTLHADTNGSPRQSVTAFRK